MDPAKKKVIWATIGGLTIIAVLIIVSILTTGEEESLINYYNAAFDSLSDEEKVDVILSKSPVIDGHNDLPYNMRRKIQNQLEKIDFSSNLTLNQVWTDNHTHTDIPRLLKGKVGAQFWVAYTNCSTQFNDSVLQTFEQIDVIKRFVNQYSQYLKFASSVKEIEEAIKEKKIASLIGVEGGHSIQSSLGILRVLYELGARYMTLTHSCNTPWADSSPVDDKENATMVAQSNGLSQFGLEVIDEMNRLGMMVDISHVSVATMKAALERSKAPVIFSHSCAYTLCNHHRNVPDDVLELVKSTNSIVMINFFSQFVKCDGGNATIYDVVDHIDYIRNKTSSDNVGIGGDYDGIDSLPSGLEDVSKYPDLFKALLETKRWSYEDLEKLAGRNLLRVFTSVEQVKEQLDEMPESRSLSEPNQGN